jgi:hypothetical protein
MNEILNNKINSNLIRIISLYTLPRLLFDSSSIVKITFDELRRKIINLKYCLDHNECYYRHNSINNKLYNLKNTKIKHIYYGKYNNWWTIRSYYDESKIFCSVA